MNWAAIETGIQAAVVAASGLAADHVLWEYEKQFADRAPAEQHITLQFGPVLAAGFDGLTVDYDAGRDVGAEMRLTTVGQRSVMLRLQCYYGPAHGNASALAALTRTRDRLVLPTPHACLEASGLAILDYGSVVHVPGVTGTAFESRATLDLLCAVTASESEYTTWIEHVVATDQILTPPQTTTYDLEGG